jgi:hypothetical protein
MNDSSIEIPFLIASNGPLQGQNWQINDQLSIGRDAGCDIVIEDRQVSRYHATLKIQKEKKIQIEDNGSKNGTFLNGEMINKSFLLHDGDEIKIALIQTFYFLSSDATIPLHEHLSSFLKPGMKKSLFLDEKSRSVYVEGDILTPPLSDAQYRLFEIFFKNEGDVVRREEVVNSVWGENEAAGVTEQAIDALVRRLRGRIGEIDPGFEYIKTIRGVGFIFENK